MRDSLLDEIAALFAADAPPPVLTPCPTGLAPMEAVDEPVRGPSRQLVFHVGAGRMYLQLDPTPASHVPLDRAVADQAPLDSASASKAHSTDLRLTGVLDDGSVLVEVRSPGSAQTLHPDAEGWFRTDVKPGPLCVTVPELGLTTGWFVA
ncbi:hypothetical protein LFM09_13315 [Lentzea alba]|uniref:hypothetical protein n=1 Tax=Lentzea alba TaxID=2714351 RepID=UPI0039BF95E3